MKYTNSLRSLKESQVVDKLEWYIHNDSVGKGSMNTSIIY